MMNSVCCQAPPLGRVADFLAQYASVLLSAGSTTLRIDKNVRRMAAVYDVRVVMTVMPRHIEIMIARGGEVASRMEYWCRGVDFMVITWLSRLSWRVAEERMPIEVAERCLCAIRRRGRIGIGPLTLMVGLANASFCRLFAGDYWAMLFVFIATVGGFYVKHRMVSEGLDVRFAVVVAASLSAIISCGASLYHLGGTPETAVATSVLYLVPGIPYINAFSDFISGHYICSLSWLFSALEITTCLGAGLFLAEYLLMLG